MKKPQFALLFATIVFCAMLLGVYIGRNTADAYYTLSPGSGETAGQDTEGDGKSASGRIDINTATKAQLMLLPGIGQVLAQRILDYRQENGAFSSTDDLLLVEGIGPGKLERIQQYITVGESL